MKGIFYHDSPQSIWFFYIFEYSLNNGEGINEKSLEKEK
jgi:hypothetical protein